MQFNIFWYSFVLKLNTAAASAAAKSLQSCPTLCDPIDGSPPVSPVPGMLQARTRVGCHFLLQCMKVKSESEVAQLCPTLRDPMDCSLPGASIRGISQARFLCPPLSPGVCSNACPLSQWYYLTILSSVIPFSSHLQSFPASGSFPMSQLFSSGGQNIRASASVLPMKIQDRFPVGLTGLISLQSKGLWRGFSSTTVQKHEFFGVHPSLWSNFHIHPYIHDYWTWLFSPCPVIVRGLCVLAAPMSPVRAGSESPSSVPSTMPEPTRAPEGWRKGWVRWGQHLLKPWAFYSWEIVQSGISHFIFF